MSIETTTPNDEKRQSEIAVIIGLIRELLKVDEPSETQHAALGALLLDGVRRSVTESLAGESA